MCAETENWQDWLQERRGRVTRSVAGGTGVVLIPEGLICHVKGFGLNPNNNWKHKMN